MASAIIFNNIIKVAIALGGIYFAIFPVIISSFYFRLKRISVLLSISLGILAEVIAIAVYGFVPWLAIIPLSVSLGVLVMNQLLNK